jgi:hypothetical protein
MFPTVDVGVIEMILESVGGSQDRAIETLLSMTDPEFKPDDRHVRTEEEVSWGMINVDGSRNMIWTLNLQDPLPCRMSKTLKKDVDSRGCLINHVSEGAGLNRAMTNSARTVKAGSSKVAKASTVKLNTVTSKEVRIRQG